VNSDDWLVLGDRCVLVFACIVLVLIATGVLR